MFNIVSSLNRMRKRKTRSQSFDHINPWIYKPAELWRIGEHPAGPTRRRSRSTVFTLKEMEEATRGFSDVNLVGKGGFGRVYRGVLKNGELVAVKKMDTPIGANKADSEREFRVEVDVLSRLDHPNLVSLIGYCADGKHRFLVYEFMPRGNLQDLLNGKFTTRIGEVKMDWALRLKIALGAARGLAYLHSSSTVGMPIVHRDLKSSNILLTESFEAKISDFGLAKFMPEGADLYTTTRVLGTFGYFDPEYAQTGKLTLQSDVYAFGVVLLELLTGRQAIDLSNCPTDENIILKVHQLPNDRKKLRRVVDPVMPVSSYTMEAVASFADLASRCVSFDSRRRPTMVDCVKELQFITYANMRL